MQEAFGNYTVEVGTIDGTSMSLVVLSSEASVQQRLQDMNLMSSIPEGATRKLGCSPDAGLSEIG